MTLQVMFNTKGASHFGKNIRSGSILLPNIRRGQDARTTNLQKWDAPDTNIFISAVLSPTGKPFQRTALTH